MPSNHQKTYDFLMISEGTEVNQFNYICLILEVKFGRDPLFQIQAHTHEPTLQFYFKTLTHIYILGQQFHCYKHRISRSDGGTSLNKNNKIFVKLNEYLTLLKSEKDQQTNDLLLINKVGQFNLKMIISFQNIQDQQNDSLRIISRNHKKLRIKQYVNQLSSVFRGHPHSTYAQRGRGGVKPIFLDHKISKLFCLYKRSYYIAIYYCIQKSVNRP